MHKKRSKQLLREFSTAFSGRRHLNPVHLAFHFIIAGIILTGLTGLPAPGFARADTASNHLTLDEIVVTGDSQAGSTELGIKTIEKGKNITIPDVLKSEPDIDMKRRTLVGDTADTLSIRGFSGNRILLNIDGRPVNSAGVVGGYYIDWGTIPLDNIETIQLVRGGSCVQYGNNALGGVINVITKKPTKTPTLNIFGTYGGGDMDPFQNFRVTHTYKTGILGYSLSGSYQEADPFLWNNDFKAKNLSGTMILDMPVDGQLSLGLQYANSRRGFIRANRLSTDPDDPNFYQPVNSDYPVAFGETFSPYSGTAFTPGPGADWDKTKYYLDFGYSQPIQDALLEIKLYKNYEDREEKNYSSSALNNAYADGELVLDRDVESDRSYGGSIELTKPFGAHELLIGAEHKLLAYGDTDTQYVDMTYNNAFWVSEDDLSFKPSSEGVCWGYYLQDTWQLTDNWILTGGLRYDTYENKSINGSTLPELNDSALSPKLTGTWRITNEDTLTASLYQALRTPGLPETYWWAKGATNGNPVLKPETSNAAELFYQHRFHKSDFIRFATYYYNVEDYIMFRFDPSWRGTYNIDEARIYGASVDGRIKLSDWISANASLTWQQSEKKGDIYDTAGLSDEIDYLPEWKANVGFEFALPRQSTLSVTLRYVGERQTIYGYSSGWPATQHFKLVELDPHFTADANLKIPVNRHIELSFYGENLFDKDYEEQFGYPMPGMIIGAAIKFSL